MLSITEYSEFSFDRLKEWTWDVIFFLLYAVHMRHSQRYSASKWTCLSRCWTQVSSTRDVVFDETGKFDPHLPYAKDELFEATDERRNAYGSTEREATNQWPLRWYLG